MDGAAIDVLPEVARWRARAVNYYRGNWQQLRSVIPTFALADFVAGPEEPANPFLRTVVRNPLTRTERPMPIGLVSNSYALVQHTYLGDLCIGALEDGGIDTSEVKCELGLSELGEWMNLRIYYPKEFALQFDNGDLDLRFEAFNSVDGSTRLTVLLGWFRFICSNGLVIGKSLLQVSEVHNPTIDLNVIKSTILNSTDLVIADRARLAAWQKQLVPIESFKAWADHAVSDQWGKIAACRVFHICTSGFDVELADPFARGAASEKPVTQPMQVPGAPARARNLYDACQALSWVATRRKDAQEKVAWQAMIPSLIKALAATSKTTRSARVQRQ